MISRFTMGSNLRVASAVVAMAYALSGTQWTRAEDRLSAIIANVRTNELLYENLEVRMSEHYEIVGRKATVKQANGQRMLESAATDKRVRYVSQDGMFRVDVEGQSTTAEQTFSDDRIRTFDGETTRVLDQNHIGNIARGRIRDEHFVRPHMLLLRHAWAMVPLSTRMQGDEALALVPEHPRSDQTTHSTTYEGEVEYHGLRCHKVWLTSWIKGSKDWNGRRQLWLAEDRNYIPVRMISYTFRWSPTIPVGEATVTEFREIEKGIWFPFGMTSTHYDDLTLQREKRQKPAWRRTYSVQEVSLHPKYDISFFRDLEFPVGASMYEVEDGNIVRSYIQGGSGDPELTKPASRWWMLWAGLGGMVLLGGAFWAWRWRRQRLAAA